jgi:outer membrane protein assembly factor BamB
MHAGTTMRRRKRGAGVLTLSVALLALLSGCSDSLPSLPKVSELNPFKEKIPPLPGKRIPVMPAQEKISGELADGSARIVIPPPRINESWAQPGGESNNAPGNLELPGSIKQAWSADAGKGSSKTGRVMASPIVYDGRVYALDAQGNVSAFAVSGGSAVWRVSLAPDNPNKGSGFSASSLFSLGGGDDGGAYGGGLAADGGRIYAASGYGTVVALEPGTGKRLWEKSLGVPIRASPTSANERVYVTSIEGRLYCLSGIDGTELWSVRGLPQQASLGLNSSPAIEGDIVVVPYASGDLVGLKVADGAAVWSESLSRTRTTSQLASMSDAARPAIEGGVVFAIGHGGRMVATKTSSGERLWSLNVPGTQMPWVAGESVYVVDTSGQLMAINRRDGKIQWTSKMAGATTWSGPVLANGTLWLTSNKGHLAGVDALTGRATGQMELGDPIYIAPIVAQGRMFVLTDEAKLIALN